jgi:cellobiose epimerase
LIRRALARAAAWRALRQTLRTAAQTARLRGVPTHPSADDLARQAARCRALLERSIIDFYLPAALDVANGGYYEDADERGVFRPTPDRFLSLQARQLWLFSTLAAEGIRRDEALAAARAGYAFVRRFRDETHGGFFSKVSVAGMPVDPRKEICLNGFALYALVAYHRATGESAPLEEARQLFAELEAHAYDARHGGYVELFEADWTPIADPTVRGYWARGGTKTLNGHMHLLETYAELLRSWPDPLVARRLAELVAINQWAVKHPRFDCNLTRWTPSWGVVAEPGNLRASYGHDLEGVWLTLDAARTLGWAEDALRNWATALAGYSLEHGYDTRHGGFHVAGPVGRRADVRGKEWWAQAEALVAMLELYELTSDPGYYAVFAATLDFIEQHQVAAGGGWWSIRRADGSADPRGTLGSPYQDGYHSGRALLRSERLLERLSATR